MRGRLEMKLDPIATTSLSSSSSSTSFQPSLVRLGLVTIHDTNKNNSTIPHLELDLNLFSTNRNISPLQIKYIQPHYQDTTSTCCKSQTEISFSTNHDVFKSVQPNYKLHVLFTRCISRLSLFSTGIQMDSRKGLAWLLRWTNGDVCIYVPIHLSSIILGGGGVSYGNAVTRTTSTLLYCVSSLYIAFWNYVIDAIIGDIIQRGINGRLMGLKESGSKSSNAIDMDLVALKKEQKDAQLQIQLMKRKAMANKKVEEEKGGLVIVDATYGSRGGECIDVSIQLQFWVSDSRLILASNSKSQMLGFYDVTKSASKSIATTNREFITKKKSGLVALWYSLFSDDNEEGKGYMEQAMVPVLVIRYKFSGVLYDIRVLDNEAITIPSPRAVKVRQE